jgi:periplasmic copper chaperone A
MVREHRFVIGLPAVACPYHHNRQAMEIDSRRLTGVFVMNLISTRHRILFMALALLVAPLVFPTWAGASSHAKTLKVEGAFARATIGAGKTGAAYLTIHNPTSEADRLIGASTSAAKRVAPHTHLHEDGVMKMRPIKAVEIPAHGMAELKPGGDHLMLMGLKAPLKKGAEFSLTLKFEKAGAVSVTVKIGAVGATSAGHGAHKHKD